MLKDLQRKLSSYSTGRWFIPVFVLLFCLLAFGLLFASLGFYWDDWTIIFVKKSGGLAGLWDFYQYDRPASTWIHALSGFLLGANPARWAVYFAILRWVTALTGWVVLEELWPKRRGELAAAAALFAVYPTFLQQPTAVTYSALFIDFAVYFISIWAMLRAVKDRRNYWAWTALALLTTAIHLVSEEYFAGLELARPIFLYIVASQAGSKRVDLRQIARDWAPYLFVLAGFVIWRLFFVTVLQDPNQVTLFRNLLRAPAATLINAAQSGARYFVQMLVGGWYATSDPRLLILSDRVFLFSALIAGIAFAVSYLSLGSIKSEREDRSAGWAKQALLVGAVLVVLGMLPVLATERDLFTGLYADRLTIPAMLGAALFWVGLARLVLQDRSHRIIFVSLLIALAVGLHVRTANIYRRDWEKQTRIYWETVWRTGKLAANTPMISTGALSGYVSEYSASAAFNMLFRSTLQNGLLDYWYFDLYDDFPETLDQLHLGIPVAAFHRGLQFEGKSSDAIYTHFSSNGQCVWFLDKMDVNNPQVPEEMRSLIEASTLKAVNPSIDDGYLPPAETFGDEPEHTWCYYYQKIDLAQERRQWDTLLDLWATAQREDQLPNNQLEVIPVIQAFVETSDFEAALGLSLDTFRRQPDAQPMLCALWADWRGNIPQALDEQATDLFERLACG